MRTVNQNNSVLLKAESKLSSSLAVICALLVALPVASAQLRARLTIFVLLGTDNCCYCSGALVTGVRGVAGIGVDDHHLGHVTADYRARFRYQA